jgi:uncharacterized protein YdaU (DUF1376 family)
MSKGLQYLPWYHGDFLRSTVGWTLNERAVYWMLLCAQWEIGPLPDDLYRLGAIAGIDPAAMTETWKVVSKKFKRTKAGLINPRMADHKRNYQRYRATLSAAGKKGMKARWGDRAKTADVIHFSRPEKSG